MRLEKLSKSAKISISYRLLSQRTLGKYFGLSNKIDGGVVPHSLHDNIANWLPYLFDLKPEATAECLPLLNPIHIEAQRR
jgi:hypothetical protein